MMLHEIIKSCVNPSVAEAAVCSIGVKFAQHVLAAAECQGQSRGAYVSRVVLDFSDDAGPDERRRLMVAISRSDQPILMGLKLILLEAMRDDTTADWPLGRHACMAGLSACAEMVGV